MQSQRETEVCEGNHGQNRHSVPGDRGRNAYFLALCPMRCYIHLFATRYAAIPDRQAVFFGACRGRLAAVSHQPWCVATVKSLKVILHG